MSRTQRDKGQHGEREAAALIRDLTGWDVRRRVRQHDGDADLEGVPGWIVEVKRHRTATRGDIARWWRQTVAQADDLLPVLMYRRDRDEWRAVWPLAVLLTHQSADYWRGDEWTAETTVEAWAAVARECEPPRTAARRGMSTTQRDKDSTGEHEAGGSSLSYFDAGNSDPIGCVDSDVTVWLT